MNWLLLYLSLCLCSLCQLPRLVKSWPNHDVSTLKHLQIVHRHGERTVNFLEDKDPFQNLSKYWPEGLGQLTNRGKNQMYKLGQYLRQEYKQYLGDEFSPREVYARSSAQTRVLESAACLLAGVYPPNSTQWQWDTNLGKMWQPIPIETLVPSSEDKLLRDIASCPKAREQENAIESSEYVQKQLRKERDFLGYLGQLVGTDIESTIDCKNIYEFLTIEYGRGLKWSDVGMWSKQNETMIFEKILPLAELFWQTKYSSSIAQRIRAGPLIQVLLNNMKSVVDSGPSQTKVHIYSTHDSVLAILLSALQVFNGRTVAFSATVIFELHQKSNSDPYFVRIYYLNETEPQINSYLLALPECNDSGECPINEFSSLCQQKIPEDWNVECGITTETTETGGTNVTLTLTDISLLIINIAILLILIINLTLLWRRRRMLYQSFD